MAPVPNGLNLVGGSLPEHRLPGARAPWLLGATSSPGVNWRSTQDITEWVNDPANGQRGPKDPAFRLPSYDEISAVVKTQEGRNALRAVDGYDMRSNRFFLYGPNDFSGKDFVADGVVVRGADLEQLGRLLSEAQKGGIVRGGERPVIVGDYQDAVGAFNVMLREDTHNNKPCQVLNILNVTAFSAVPLPKDGQKLSSEQKIQLFNAHDDWELYLNLLNGNNVGSAGRVVSYRVFFNGGHGANLYFQPSSGRGVWFVAAEPQKLVVAAEPPAPVVAAGASASQASASGQTVSGPLVIPGAGELVERLLSLGVPADKVLLVVDEVQASFVAGFASFRGALEAALKGKQ